MAIVCVERHGNPRRHRGRRVAQHSSHAATGFSSMIESSLEVSRPPGNAEGGLTITPHSSGTAESALPICRSRTSTSFSSAPMRIAIDVNQNQSSSTTAAPSVP